MSQNDRLKLVQSRAQPYIEYAAKKYTSGIRHRFDVDDAKAIALGVIFHCLAAWNLEDDEGTWLTHLKEDIRCRLSNERRRNKNPEYTMPLEPDRFPYFLLPSHRVFLKDLVLQVKAVLLQDHYVYWALCSGNVVDYKGTKIIADRGSNVSCLTAPTGQVGEPIGVACRCTPPCRWEVAEVKAGGVVARPSRYVEVPVNNVRHSCLELNLFDAVINPPKDLLEEWDLSGRPRGTFGGMSANWLADHYLSLSRWRVRKAIRRIREVFLEVSENSSPIYNTA